MLRWLLIGSAFALPLWSSHILSLDTGKILYGGLSARYEYPLYAHLNLTSGVEGQARVLSPVPQAVQNGVRILWWGAFPEALAVGQVGLKLHYGGWYVEPFIKSGYAQIRYLDAVGTRHLAVLSPGAVLGYQETLPFGLALNLGMGLQGRVFLPHGQAKTLILPEATLAFGYAF